LRSWKWTARGGRCKGKRSLGASWMTVTRAPVPMATPVLLLTSPTLVSSPLALSPCTFWLLLVKSPSLVWLSIGTTLNIGMLVFVSIPAVAQQSGSLVIKNVTVIDMTGTPPRPNMTVIIEGDRIRAIGATKKIRIPHQSQIIDAQGLFLIPGLWDMHVHFTEIARTFPMFIANGVTGVRNVGGDLEQLLKWRAEVASGKLLGPRIVTCGPILDGPDPAEHGRFAAWCRDPGDIPSYRQTWTLQSTNQVEIGLVKERFGFQ